MMDGGTTIVQYIQKRSPSCGCSRLDPKKQEDERKNGAHPAPQLDSTWRFARKRTEDINTSDRRP
eukprot:scaffold13609_cov151-Amphora_coffeaeformis.AAC.3